MKPEPLDFDRKIKKISNYIIELLIFTKLSNEEKKELKNTLETEIDELINKIKQRIKSACEFYLRYKDNLFLLGQEHSEYIEKLKEFGYKIIDKESAEISSKYDSKKYNEWLFKLAFKDVMKNDINK